MNSTDPGGDHMPGSLAVGRNSKRNGILLLLALVLLLAGRSAANNLQIGTPSVSGNTITFTVQWDNSWKISSGSYNWDAVWVFIKYQDCANQLWQHMNIAGPNSVTGGVLQVDQASDNKGVFIRRISDGNGNISSATVTLTMSLTDAGYNYQVFGVEMVYVPQASFYIGDGASSNAFANSGCTSAPYQVTSNAAFNLYYSCSFIANMPAAFPKGYDAFYSMKYEITQEQYVGFLNTLTYDQQVNHTSVPPSSAASTLALSGATQNRNGIKVMSPGTFNNTPAVYGCDLTAGTFNSANDGQNLPVNWINWDDLAAYLDWAALRPMTEMEYEKSCRGTVLPVNYEYPWGSAIVSQATSSAISNASTSTEVSTAATDGLCAYGVSNTLNGPLRAGFAATSTTGRTYAGATFYGILDMAGNMYEQVVQCSSTNTTFTTTAGDGALSATGYANTANWPTYANTITRGGNWYTNSTAYLRTSDRSTLSFTEGIKYFQFRSYLAGGRGVRMP